MNGNEFDFIWSNENEFLKIEKNGKPDCKALHFILENNKARFIKAFEIPKTEINEFLNKFGFKPTNKVLTLSE